jgi:hypothetical protein
MNEKFKPEVFETMTDPKLRAHFEKYDGEAGHENGEPEFDEIREEIADHFGIPYTTDADKDSKDSATENHIVIVDNDMVENQRHYRAYSIVIREKGGKRDAWYIDGRLPHATMLRRLYGHYNVPEDDDNEIILGFLDEEGFPDNEIVQERAKQLGKPIKWFIRDVVKPDNISPEEEKKVAEDNPDIVLYGSPLSGK